MIDETMSLLDESNVRKLFRLLKKYADRKTLELRNTSLELLMADIFFRYVTNRVLLFTHSYRCTKVDQVMIRDIGSRDQRVQNAVS